MPAHKSDKTSKPAVRKPAKRAAAQGKAATTLPESMASGKASAAKAAEGDTPVFAYIASLPQPQRGIAECIDALAARTLPGLQRSVKWAELNVTRTLISFVPPFAPAFGPAAGAEGLFEAQHAIRGIAGV